MTINETIKALEKKHCENCSCSNCAEEKDYCNGLCEIGSAILLLNAFNRKFELQTGEGV